MNKKISIITPCFNAEQFIAQTIDSVLQQTYTNWEMILIDDCSEDKTVAIIKRYIQQNKNIRLIQLEKNSGLPAVPRNIGIQEAKGKWIAFLDADDIWHPQKLQKQMEVANSQKVVFIVTKMKDFKKLSQINFNSVKNNKTRKITFGLERLKSIIPTSSVLIQKDFMLQEPFPEDFKYKAVEDGYVWLRILKKVDYAIKLQDHYVYYRVSENQISSSKFSMLKSVFMIQKELANGNILLGVFFSFTHIIFSLYYRLLKKEL